MDHRVEHHELRSPDYKSRVKNIKKLGVKGNKFSLKLSKILGVKNPIPSFKIDKDSIENEIRRMRKIGFRPARGLEAEIDKLINNQ